MYWLAKIPRNPRATNLPSTGLAGRGHPRVATSHAASGTLATRARNVAIVAGVTESRSMRPAM